MVGISYTSALSVRVSVLSPSVVHGSTLVARQSSDAWAVYSLDRDGLSASAFASGCCRAARRHDAWTLDVRYTAQFACRPPKTSQRDMEYISAADLIDDNDYRMDR